MQVEEENIELMLELGKARARELKLEETIDKLNAEQDMLFGITINLAMLTGRAGKTYDDNTCTDQATTVLAMLMTANKEKSLAILKESLSPETYELLVNQIAMATC